MNNKKRNIYFYGSIEDINMPILRGGQRVTMQMAEILNNINSEYSSFIVYKSSFIDSIENQVLWAWSEFNGYAS